MSAGRKLDGAMSLEVAECIDVAARLLAAEPGRCSGHSRPLVLWPCTMASIARLAATGPDGTEQATPEGTGAKNLGPRMHTTDSQGI
jgi:hypothetical protein